MNDERPTRPGTIDKPSGEGGALGTPNFSTGEEPPSADQEANEAVSGGGMVDPTSEDEPRDTADESR